MLVEKIKRRAEEYISLELGAAPGLFDRKLNRELPPLPLYLKGARGEIRGRELTEAIREWIRGGNAPITQLSAPIGFGKTVATCMLQRTIQCDADEEGKVAAWIPMRWDPRAEIEPSRLVPSLLGIVDDHELGNDVYCVILDGIDEYLSRGPETSRLDKLLKILEVFCHCRVPVVISGREIALSTSPLYRLLRARIESLCRRSDVNASGPEVFELGEWADIDWYRGALKDRVMGALTEDEWQQHLSSQGLNDREEAIDRQLGSVGNNVLKSPLLFGLAYDVLVEQLRQGKAPHEMKDEWQLTEGWVENCLDRNEPRFRDRSASGVRRSVAQRMSLYLAVSGRGTSGVGWRDLEQEQLHWIWDNLKASEPDTWEVVDPEISNPRLRARISELAHCCLLRAHEHHLAPFHQHILRHLAAEGLNTLTEGKETMETLVHLEPSVQELQMAVWGEIGRDIGIDGLSQVGALVASHIEGPALNADSDFSKVLRYWSHNQHKGLRAPLKDFRQFYRFEPSEAEDDRNLHGRRIVGAVARFLDTLELPDSAQAMPNKPVAIGDMAFHRIPAGTHLVWGLDRDGNAIPVWRKVTAPFLLARDLVTVEQYAKFLLKNPEARLPNQPEMSWKRKEGKVIYREGRGKEPVSGVSTDEAKQFCEWLTQEMRVDLSDQEDIALGPFQLPHSSHLQVAAHGNNLQRGHWSQPGRFGHVNLLCKVWQHTNDYWWPSPGDAAGSVRVSKALDSDECVVFGGSIDLAGQPSEPPESAADRRDWAQKEYEKGYPEGTSRVLATSRGENLGFRIGVELLDKIKSKAMRDTQPLLAGSSPPPDDPEDSGGSDDGDGDYSPPPRDPPDAPSKNEEVSVPSPTAHECLSHKEIVRLSKEIGSRSQPSSELARVLVGRRGLAGEQFEADADSDFFWYEVINRTAGPNRSRTDVVSLLEEVADIARQETGDLDLADHITSYQL